MVRNICVLSFVLLGLLVLHVNPMDTDTDIVYEYCKPWKFFSNTTGQCEKCPGCKRGQYHDNSSLGPLDKQRGALECYTCSQCPEGKYSDKHTRDYDGFRYCRQDRNCTKKNRQYKKNPKQSRKSKCGPCLDGYIQESNWDEEDGVCNKIQKTTSLPDVKVKNSPDVKVTNTRDVKVANSPNGVKATSSVDTTASNPEDYIAPIESTTQKSIQEAVPIHNIGHIEETVKEEAKRNRDHHQRNSTIIISLISGVIIIGLLILGFKCRKKIDCFKSSTDEERGESPLGSSKTPLMVDGPSSQQSSPQQSVIGIGLPKVTTIQTLFCETQGSNVALLSLVTGGNIQSVVWKRIQGGEYTDLVVDNKKYKGSTTTNPSLQIYHLCAEDQGAYLCTATNHEGTGQGSVCKLKITENPDLVFTCTEIAKAKKIKLQPYDDKMIQCVANYAKGNESEDHMMETLYDKLGIKSHTVKQIWEETRDKGARECVIETLSSFVKQNGKNATVFALYEALTDCQYFYELKFYVEAFRAQLSDKNEDIPVNDDTTIDGADGERQVSSDISAEDFHESDVLGEQETVNDHVRLGIEGVKFTVLDH